MTSHIELAHRWAQLGPESTSQLTGCNMFYDGATIYSYGEHFPIAKHVRDASGKHVVLFTTDSYSSSTGKHKSHASSACSHLNVFSVPCVTARTKAAHKGNYKAMKKALREHLITIGRKRVGLEWAYKTYIDALKQLNSYTAAFKLGFKAMPLPESLECLIKLSKDDIAKARKADAIKARKLRAQYVGQAKEWIEGKAYSVPCGAGTFLRLRNDTTVETSRNAIFPIEHAKKAWKFINKCHQAKQKWKANGHTIKVGYYSIEWIDAKGNLKAGCHKLQYSEMLRFATLQGW